MSDDDLKKRILDVLSGAILRETEAFNYYTGNAADQATPPGVKGLFTRLAEEERLHRHLLINEFLSFKRGWRGEEDKGSQAPSYGIPEKLPFLPLRVSEDLEAAAVCLPGRLVGGDNLFSAILRDHGGRPVGTLIVLYDAMGHSVETTETNALAARVIGERFDAATSARMEREMLSPDAIARLLNRKLHEAFDGRGVFITLFCALFDPRGKILTYTCGGQEPPFVRRADGRVETLLNAQLIVGIDPEFDYTADAVPFGPGDLLCLFTDGLIEVRNGAGDLFGRSGVRGMLERTRTASPREVVTGILGAAASHAAGELIRDEISIVVVRAKGA
jgi:serine phosphatase RsbU (regulator of sigma subunit)